MCINNHDNRSETECRFVCELSINQEYRECLSTLTAWGLTLGVILIIDTHSTMSANKINEI